MVMNTNIKTNFNTAIEEKLQSLIDKELKEIIFFQTNPIRFIGSFPSRDRPFIFTGSRLALAFKMPPLSKREPVLEVLSLKSTYFDLDSYIINNRFGGHIWNLDFHFDTIFAYKKTGAIKVNKIEEVELIEKHSKHRWRIVNSFTSFSGGKQTIKKIEVFGMKEYFEDISKVDFENMPYDNPKPFEIYEYPIDIDIVTYIIISLSEGTFLHIQLSVEGIHTVFCNEEEIEQKRELMKARKNAFGRPFAKLMFTTES